LAPHPVMNSKSATRRFKAFPPPADAHPES